MSKKAILATAVAIMGIGTMGAPTAYADISASFAASNMYFWRGLNISDPSPAVSGSLDYSHESGFYAGIWGSSEGWFDNSSEFDLYLGYGGEIGGFSYDASYVAYFYPSAEDEALPLPPGSDVSISDTDLAEVVLGVGYGGFSAKALIGANDALEDSLYYTLGYEFGKFGVTYGNATNDGDGLWSHITLDFNATDSLNFKLSKAMSDDYEVNEDPLFVVSYSLSFDL
ncbi:MAG: TorF family putative porin [Thiotrichales bacterium]